MHPLPPHLFSFLVGEGPYIGAASLVAQQQQGIMRNIGKLKPRMFGPTGMQELPVFVLPSIQLIDVAWLYGIPITTEQIIDMPHSDRLSEIHAYP